MRGDTSQLGETLENSQNKLAPEALPRMDGGDP
jgi:hypothetical protein